MTGSSSDRPLLAVAIDPEHGCGLATAERAWSIPVRDLGTELGALRDAQDPRWVWWDRATPTAMVGLGLGIDRCWDVVAVHRLLSGRWRLTVPEVWADLQGLDPESIPSLGQLDLLRSPDREVGDPEAPIDPDGHLRPEWSNGAWAHRPTRMAAWAGLALDAAHGQIERLSQPDRLPRALATARAESATELLCAELAEGGLPIDQAEAERIIAAAAGPRPQRPTDEDVARADRDAPVLSALSASAAASLNLRNPGDVKAMLNREGINLPDTRAWRLEEHRDDHPVIEALLRWRKQERIATTYGYRWLDEYVDEGRLRGEWGSSDGAAGRMTASAGLHNLPAEMRSAVAAEPGHALVRADLGQVEPRVLAAVSGDPDLIAATAANDLYHTIAVTLGVDREDAKLAVLGAMYGATTGRSAHVLPALRHRYPIAMGFLEEMADRGRRGADIHTVGGRRVRTGGPGGGDGDLDRARVAAEARGRFARNAAIQGAAAEFFKVWAITVRRRIRPFGAEIVLCLHDELLVHATRASAAHVADALTTAIDEAAHYWSPSTAVRFLAETTIIDRWSEAKGGPGPASDI